METKNEEKKGKLTMEQKGIFQVWGCSCKHPQVEIDETTVVCLEELGGCGAVLHKGGEE